MPTERTGSARNQRISQSPGIVQYEQGGLGFIGRRGLQPQDRANLRTLESVQWMAAHYPHELLALLPDVVPEVGLAVWNFLQLAAAPDTLTLKAMTIASAVGAAPDPTPGEEDADLSDYAQEGSEEAPDGTALIKGFFAQLPDEVGGLTGALGQNMQQVLMFGMSAVEYVPGGGREGRGDCWPLPVNTIDFARNVAGDLTLHQLQVTSNRGIVSGAQNYVALPMERTFWSSLHPTPGNPYGRAPFAPALSEVLVNLAFMRDLALAFHRVGAPKTDITFDFEMWTKLARMIPNLSGEGPVLEGDIQKWVQDKFKQAQDYYASLHPDDAYFHDRDSKVQMVGSGSAWPDVPGIYALFRWRLIIALKMLPVLMGVVDGSTETWSLTQWKIWTAGLDSIIRCAAEPLRRAAERMLQNEGKPYRVEMVIEPPRTSQRLTEAQAEAQEIKNALAKEAAGYITHDEGSMEITGTPAVGPGYTVVPPSAPGQGEPPAPGAQEGENASQTVEAALRRRAAIFASYQDRRRYWEAQEGKNGHSKESVTA